MEVPEKFKNEYGGEVLISLYRGAGGSHYLAGGPSRGRSPGEGIIFQGKMYRRITTIEDASGKLLKRLHHHLSQVDLGTDWDEEDIDLEQILSSSR